jgi:hypothetical protein
MAASIHMRKHSRQNNNFHGTASNRTICVKKAGLRIRDVYPGSRILIFTHPGSRISTATKDRGEKKLVVIPFCVATNFTNCKLF